MGRRRLTGISSPWFGVQWEHVKDHDKRTAHAVLDYLEDRRVLFRTRHAEDQQHCMESAFAIRAFLTERLMADDIGADLATTLKAMRSACREFIDAGGPDAANFTARRQPHQADPFGLALGELRSRIGFYVQALAA